MTEAQIQTFIYLTGISLALSFSGILLLGGLLELETKLSHWIAASAIPALILGIAISSLLSGRNLKYASLSIESISTGPAQGGPLLRIITFSLVGLCLSGIISHAFQKKPSTTPAGRGLILGFIFFYICNNILNSIFGSRPGFSHNSIYVAIVFIAIFMYRSADIAKFILLAKFALLSMMVASLICAVTAPSLALQPNYTGWVPGLDIRLWGLGSNPNSIGPLAVVLLLLEICWPSTRKTLQVVLWTCGLTVLTLAQSKTAWLAGIFSFLIVTWYCWGRQSSGGIRLGYLFSVFALLIVTTTIAIFIDTERIWVRFINSAAGDDLVSLTGRARIWDAALTAWRDNLVFGYGPQAWGSVHRSEIGLPFAFSAHNQFMQSLSTSGGLGFLSLTVYLLLLLNFAWQAAPSTRGASMALLLFLLIRCVTETPLEVGTLFNGDTIMQLILFRCCLQTHMQTATSISIASLTRRAVPVK